MSASPRPRLCYTESVLPAALLSLLNVLIQSEVPFWASELEDYWEAYEGWDDVLAAMREADDAGTLCKGQESMYREEWHWPYWHYAQLALQRERYLQALGVDTLPPNVRATLPSAACSTFFFREAWTENDISPAQWLKKQETSPTPLPPMAKPRSLTDLPAILARLSGAPPSEKLADVGTPSKLQVKGGMFSATGRKPTPSTQAASIPEFKENDPREARQHRWT
ncbi:hypothetical protein JCM10213v2_001708 [Rhodosporidiobolus nylandii]